MPPETRRLDNDTPQDNFQLLDFFEPPLKDGSYTLAVTQTLSAPGASITDFSQPFVVSGPRFTLDPAEVAAEFPPDGACGTFDEFLPHVVLNRRLLPWERDVPGLDAKAPWVAVMIFEEGELLGTGNGVQTMTVSTLLNSQPDTVRVPSLTGAYAPTADELSMNCSVITMAGATFAGLVPTGRELPYLAHARQVALAGKTLADAAMDGMYSVAVANRFPMPGTTTQGARCVAHLVSLEGFGDLLSGVNPSTPTQAQVMMVSLYSWTFSCLADPTQTFAGLAENLVYSDVAAKTPWPAASLLLQLPCTAPTGTGPAVTEARQRVASGYVALGYHAQTGEDNFAWYRGPFSPVVPNAVAAPGAFVTADAAWSYDSTYGVFDGSLAAAWQCGQTLALAAEGYATTLMRLRQRTNAQLDAMAATGKAAVQARLGALFAGGVTDRIGDLSHGLAGSRPARRARRARRELSARRKDIQALLARPEVRASLGDGLLTDPDALAVAAWLGQLQLLSGVPFVHLVPDARMLPAESLRFFYLDPNWVSALTAGALALGLGSSRELAVQSALTTVLEAMAAEWALTARADALGQTPPTATSGPTGGLLIRSALIAGWPGLSVTGTCAGEPVAILRLEPLAPTVMLCLFNGVPDTVVIEQPHEGLAFGVDDNGNVETRNVSGATVTTTTGPLVYQPSNPTQTLVTMRSGGQRVLNVNVDPAFPSSSAPTSPVDLLGSLAQALDVGTADLGPATFALQMVKGPELVTFCQTPVNSVAKEKD